MGFFKNLIDPGGTSREDEQVAFVEPMKEMADEAERVHRNMVGIYSEEFTPPTDPTGEGLYKARLHAAVMTVWAYAQVTNDEDGGMEMMNVASGLALEPLLNREGSEAFSREEAEELGVDYLIRALKATTLCMEEGPSLPGKEQPGFENLADLIHESLEDSIGDKNYTHRVRERFDTPVKAQLSTELKHAAELAGQDRTIR